MNNFESNNYDELISFLACRIPNKELIEYIVLMLPNRYFYYPEVTNVQFATYRQEMSDLIKEARRAVDDYPAMNADYLRKEYDDRFKQLVCSKRKLLVFGILLQDEDRRREILYRLIDDNHLRKHLKRMKEVFRV